MGGWGGGKRSTQKNMKHLPMPFIQIYVKYVFYKYEENITNNKKVFRKKPIIKVVVQYLVHCAMLLDG